MLTAASVQAETIWNMKIGSDYWWTTNKVDEIKYQGDNSTADVMAGLDYVFNLSSVDFILRGGYRVMDYSFDYFAGEPVKVREEGFFTGIELNF